jgi:hypothetical protein
LTAVSSTHKPTHTENVLTGLVVDDSPNIQIGGLLVGLGIPVFGIITGLQVLPSPVDTNTLRVLINYFPLRKPNIPNCGSGLDTAKK